jgi:hypothetical protein
MVLPSSLSLGNKHFAKPRWRRRLLAAITVSSAVLSGPAALAAEDYDEVTLIYQWLIGDSGSVPLPYDSEPLGIGDLQDVMSANLKNVPGDDGVSVTLKPLWSAPSDQNVTQVAFQLYDHDEDDNVQKWVAGDVSYTASTDCSPAPTAEAVDCSLTSIEFDKKINGAGTNDVDNLNFLVDLPPGGKGGSGGGIAPRLTAGESLTLHFYGTGDKKLRVHNFMTPAISNPSAPPPFYSCAHIQSISSGGGELLRKGGEGGGDEGGGAEGSRTVCATDFEEPVPPDPDTVPSPLGVMGVAAALRASRQLRGRLRSRAPKPRPTPPG